MTEPDKVEQHQLVQEEIYTHLDNIYDSLATSSAVFKTYQDNFYPQFDTDTVGALGVETIYLTTKYASTDYQVLLTARGNSQQTTTLVYSINSDSSFNVSCDSTNVTFSWYTIGAI